MTKNRFSCLIIPAMLLVSGCSGDTTDQTADSTKTSDRTASDAQVRARSQCDAGAPVTGRRLTIVTTVAPITSMVANIVGDLASVVGVVPEGTNSHTFEPAPSVAENFTEADIVFTNGLSLEDPTKELARENVPADATSCELGTSVLPVADYVYDFSFPEDGGKPNPHLWTNPPMVKAYATLITQVLSRRDPANAAAFQTNLTAFSARIDALETAFRAGSDTIPQERRALLTYHDAYAYFADRYGWRVIGAIQPSSFDEPTPKDVAGLIEQVKKVGVPAIFGSEVFPSPVLQQIGKEAGVRYVDVLRDDDLPGKPGDDGHSWLGLMKFDYVTIIEALGGDASALKALDTTDVAPDRAAYPQ